MSSRLHCPLRLILVFLLLAPAWFIILELANFMIEKSSNALTITPKQRTQLIGGHWQETLSGLGIPPFPDTLSPEALPNARPASDIRVDLRRRKRAFTIPQRSNLFFSDEATRIHPAKRYTLEDELRAFQKTNAEQNPSGRAKSRSHKKVSETRPS